MTNRVRVSTSVDPKAGNDLDKLRAKFSALQKQGAKGLMIGAGVAATNMAFTAIGRAVGAVTDFVSDATTAFMEDERSQRLLGVSLRDNVAAWDGNTAAIEKTLQARIALGFSDDEQRESLTKLIGVTKDAGKALEIQRTAMDLARMRGMSLADATELLGKVAGGNVSILRRYGIAIDKDATSTEALAAIHKMAGGQAEEYAQTLEGRVTVAAVKSGEAIESLGKTTAEFSADFEEAKAGAIENFVTGLDFLVDSLNYSSQGLDRKIELTKIDVATTTGATQAAALARLATLEHTKALVGQADRTKDDLIPAMKGARSAGSDLNRILDRMGYEADQTDKAIGDLSSAISKELFGDAINAGNLAQLQITHDELIKQRDAAGVGAKKYRELTGEIAANEQAMFELQLQMAQEAGPKALAAFLDTQMKKLGYADGAAVRYFNDLKALYNLTVRFNDLGTIAFGQYSGKTIPGFASGVQNFGGGLAVVGEDGPELVDLPKGSDVIPMSDATPTSWGGSAGSTVVNINVSTPALTPGGAEALARYLEPIITRAQQRRGQLDAARAF